MWMSGGGAIRLLLWRYLIAGPAFQAVRVEFVDVEDVNGTLDAEVVQLARHFQEQQVILGRGGKSRNSVRPKWKLPDLQLCSPTHHREELQHLSVHPSFIELVFVLRKADVVQPPWSTEPAEIRWRAVLGRTSVTVCYRTCDPDVVQLRRPLHLLPRERLDGQLELLPVERVFQRQLLQKQQTIRSTWRDRSDWSVSLKRQWWGLWGRD